MDDNGIYHCVNRILIVGHGNMGRRHAHHIKLINHNMAKVASSDEMFP